MPDCFFLQGKGKHREIPLDLLGNFCRNVHKLLTKKNLDLVCDVELLTG